MAAPNVCVASVLVCCIVLGTAQTNCPRLLARYRKRCGADEVMRNITALWDKVNSLSSPVNVYINGRQFAEIDPQQGHNVQIGNSDHNNHDHHNDHDKHHSHGSSTSHKSCEEDKVFAMCEVTPNKATSSEHNIQGTILFRQNVTKTTKPFRDLEVQVKLSGFDVKGEKHQHHAIHLHEFGDLTNGCQSFGGHFNPLGTAHGSRDSQHSHVGDWGNLSVNRTGHVDVVFMVQSNLLGDHSIVGRGVVIHAGADDLGKGHNHSSKSSGNAGGRVACCQVVYHKGNCGDWKV